MKHTRINNTKGENEMNAGRIRYIIAGALVVMLISVTLGGLYIYHQADVIRKEQQSSEVSRKKNTLDGQKKTDKKASKAVTENKETEDEDSAYINKNATWNLGKLPVTKIQEANIRIRISRYIAQQNLGMIRNAYLWNDKGIQKNGTLTEFYIICQLEDAYYVTFDVKADSSTKELHVDKVLADYASPESAPPASDGSHYTTD